MDYSTYLEVGALVKVKYWDSHFLGLVMKEIESLPGHFEIFMMENRETVMRSHGDCSVVSYETR